MDTRVTISLVTWNSARVIEPCLESLRAQRGVVTSLTVVDNASIDGTPERIRALAPDATLIRNRRNMGYGRAHNQALLLSSTPYALVLNPDTVLAPDAIARLVTTAETNPRIGAVGPRLRRYELTDREEATLQRTDVLDSTGIVRHRTGIFAERGANEPDRGQFPGPENMFALSGACLLLRREAVNSIRRGNELFDEDFFAYKEDVDLCWRLRRRGWACRYDPTALVYHRRAFTTPRHRLAPRIVRAERQRKHQVLRTLSYRNHFLTYLKNETLHQLVREAPFWIPYELGKLLFLLCTEPRTLRGLPQALRLARRIRQKRALVSTTPHA